MTIKALFPTVRPTLNLDFAKTKALDPRITFTRASTATFVGANGLIQTAASDVPRFDHNPTTGESLGLLVEEARTNLLTYSEQFDNAYWVKSNSTITTNAATAPDGQSTADALVENTANSQHFLHSSDFGGAANTTYTFSVYVKAAGRSFVGLTYGQSTTWGDQYANFDLTLGTVTLQVGVGSARINPCSNGWYRISITRTRNANSGATYAFVFTGIASNNFSYTGDGTSGIYVWGAQVELGSFPTSYIPTTTATVTRADDVASMTGTNFSSWYRQDEGTLLASIRPATSGNLSIWTLSDGTTAERMLAYSASVFNFYVDDNGSNQVNIGGYPFTTNSLSTFAAAYKTNNFAYSKNGVTPATDTSGTVPTPTKLQIMAGYIGGEIQTGTIARLAYYPVRLPDATLQALTAT